jgi:hypothetical protein
MAGKRVPSASPICEDCWLQSHTKWEPHSVNEDGNVLMKLVGVDVPEKINTGSVEVCRECGDLTISGIYEVSASPLGVLDTSPPDGDDEWGLV